MNSQIRKKNTKINECLIDCFQLLLRKLLFQQLFSKMNNYRSGPSTTELCSRGGTVRVPRPVQLSRNPKSLTVHEYFEYIIGQCPSYVFMKTHISSLCTGSLALLLPAVIYEDAYAAYSQCIFT